MADEISNITHLVQMAMTPAFMLVGMGAVISVITGQLSRVVDRERKIEELSISDKEMPAYRYEMRILKMRCKLLILGLYFSSLGWFCTCGVVLAIFASYILYQSSSNYLLISWLFSISMIAIICAVALLILEVHYIFRFSNNKDWDFLEK